MPQITLPDGSVRDYYVVCGSTWLSTQSAFKTEQKFVITQQK